MIKNINGNENISIGNNSLMNNNNNNNLCIGNNSLVKL